MLGVLGDTCKERLPGRSGHLHNKTRLKEAAPGIDRAGWRGPLAYYLPPCKAVATPFLDLQTSSLSCAESCMALWIWASFIFLWQIGLAPPDSSGHFSPMQRGSCPLEACTPPWSVTALITLSCPNCELLVASDPLASQRQSVPRRDLLRVEGGNQTRLAAQSSLEARGLVPNPQLFSVEGWGAGGA